MLDDPRLCRFAEAVRANDHWGYITPLARRWAFGGPWMSGCKAELQLSVVVRGRQSDFAFPDISFFHPRAFEMVLVNYLNDRYGHKNWGAAQPCAALARPG